MKVWEVASPLFVRVLPSYKLTRVREMLRRKEARVAVIVSDIATNRFAGYVTRREAIMVTSAKSDKEVREYARTSPILYSDMELEEAIKVLREHHEYAIPVLKSKEDPRVIGVLSFRDIIRALKSTGYIPKAKVAGEVMTDENLSSYLIDNNANINECWSRFVYDNIKALVVTRSNSNIPVGILTPKDLIDSGRWYFRRESEKGITTPAKARTIMTRGVVVAYLNTPIEDIADHMVRFDFSLVPIINERDQVIGVVTQEDVVRAYLEGIKPGKVPIPVAPPPLPVSISESPVYMSKGEILSQVLVKTRRLEASAMVAKDIVIPQFPAVRVDNTLEHVLRVMLRNRVNQVIVIDKEGKVIGSISKRNILYSLGIKGPLWKRRPFEKEFIQEVINENVPIIREETPIEEIARQLVVNEAGVAIVVDKDGLMVGTITKDALIEAVRRTKHANLKIENLIVPPRLSVVHPHHSLAHAVRKMKAYYLDALAVTEGSLVRGVVSESRLPFVAFEDAKRGIRSRKLIWVRRLERAGRPMGRYIKITPLLVEDITIPFSEEVRVDERAEKAIEIMKRHDVDGVPVKDEEGNVIGIICKYDVLRSLARSAPPIRKEWIAREARIRK